MRDVQNSAEAVGDHQRQTQRRKEAVDLPLGQSAYQLTGLAGGRH